MSFISSVALIVPDYDQAIDFYVNRLGFELLEDVTLAPGKRWVRVCPRGEAGTALLLAEASTEEQKAAIGNQTGGRVFLFLSTDDFERDHTLYLENGVCFLEEPRFEPYGTVAVFKDPFGNQWDLIEHK
ncbi:MAG: VOC family protein [Sneathiellales bacterium]|nr:VOC family protein [Sneathiellales bacterium]